VEKIIYALWAREGESRDSLNLRVKDDAAPALLALRQVHGLRLNLQDSAVARADNLRMRCSETFHPDAAVQLWLDVAHDAFRTPVDDILASVAGDIAAWSVIESTIIPNRDHTAVPGSRTEGWSQLCFLKRPSHLTHADWRHNWQVLHTPVAIDTQANFEYVQNLIIRALIPGPEDYAAIVEECFPEAAMQDPAIFFDAIDDPLRFAANTAAMAESCARFIGEDGVDLLPTSQYDLRRPG